MAWPTGADVQARTGISLTLSGTTYSTSYGLDVTALLDRAKAYAASYCNREPEYGFDEATITDETHDGALVIPVDHPPIASVTSVEWDEDTLDATNDEYYVYTDYIRIAGTVAYDLEAYEPVGEPRQVVKITYVGGYSDDSGTHIAIPSELKEIILEIACRWLLRIDEQYRLNKNISSVSIGEYQAKFQSDRELLADLNRRLEKFKVLQI